MYSISCSVSESTRVLLTPFPGWSPGPSVAGGSFAIHFCRARISPLCVMKVFAVMEILPGHLPSIPAELHSFVQQTGSFSPFAAFPPNAYFADEKQRGLRGAVSTEHLLGCHFWSFLHKKPYQVLALLHLPGSSSNQQGFLFLPLEGYEHYSADT